MKQRILLGILVATSLFAKAELSLSVGTNSFDSDESLEKTTTLGVRGDFYLDNIYHIDVGYDDLGNVKFESIPSSLDIQRYYVQFSADGEEEYHVVPSLSIGVGYEDQSGDYADSESFLSLGIGFRYNVSNSFNFLLGTKALWKTSTRDINYHTTFGVGLMFDEEPVNNTQTNVEEVVIPKEKLKIPEIHSPEPVVIKKAPVIIDTKEAIVQNDMMHSRAVVKQPVQPQVSTAGMLPPPPAVEVPAISTVKVASRVHKQTTVSGYFIQVAAFTQYKPTSLLNRLVQNGYHVVLRHQGRVTKALVGPYSSPAQAQRALYKVKKIAPRAFIYKGN